MSLAFAIMAAINGSTGSRATLSRAELPYQTSPASTRVRAAECIMNHAAKAMELEDIGVRVTALEEAAKDQNR